MTIPDSLEGRRSALRRGIGFSVDLQPALLGSCRQTGGGPSEAARQPPKPRK